MSHLNDTTSSEVLDAALGLVNMTATDSYISKSVTPDHHHRSLAVRDAIASSPIMEVDNYSSMASLPVTKPKLNACIKRIAFLAVHEKLTLRRKYLSRCDYDKITQMVKRQFNIPPNCIINLKKIQRAMLLFDSQPLIVDNNSIEPHPRRHQCITKFTLNDAAMLLELPNKQQPSISGKDVMETLVLSQKVLKQQNDHNELIPTPNIQQSCLALNHFFRHVYDSQAEVGNSNGDPSVIYCCGSAGTGKTTTVRHMAHLARDRTIKKDDAESDSLYFVNCSTLPFGTTAIKAYKYLLNHYGINKLQFRERGSSRSLDGCTIIILDEIDLIVGQKGLEGMVKGLLEIASKKESLLAIVGVSTSVFNKKSEKLLQMGMGSNKVVFPTYKKDDLMDLFRYTVGFDAINAQTVSFVAAKVSHASGDARTFFNIMDRTIDAAMHRIEENDKELLFSPYRPKKSIPLTRIHDAMEVFMSDSPQFKNNILLLPEYQRQVLILGCYVEKYFDGKPLTLSIFATFVRQAQSSESSEEMSLVQIKDIIEHLEDTGLVKVTVAEKKQRKRGSQKKLVGPSLALTLSEFSRATIRFDHALEEVECAIGEIVSDNPHYTSLVRRFEKIVARYM